jgi:hypothetical protein
MAANSKDEMSAKRLAHDDLETPGRVDRRGEYLCVRACLREREKGWRVRVPGLTEVQVVCTACLREPNGKLV